MSMSPDDLKSLMSANVERTVLEREESERRQRELQRQLDAAREEIRGHASHTVEECHNAHSAMSLSQIRRDLRSGQIEYADQWTTQNSPRQLITDIQILQSETDHDVEATRIAVNHNDHVITNPLIHSVAQWVLNGDEQAKEDIQDITRFASKYGFMLLAQTQGGASHRIASQFAKPVSPQYCMASLHAKHPNPAKGKLHQEGIWAADAQIHIAEPTENAEQIMPRITDPSRRCDDAWLRKVEGDPGRHAHWEDVQCLNKFRGFALTPALFDACMEQICTTINPSRGEYPMQHVTCEVGAVVSVKLHGIDTEIPFGAPIPDEEMDTFQKDLRDFNWIKNGPSFRMVEGFRSRSGRVTPFQLRGSRFVRQPFRMGEDTHELGIIWFLYGADVIPD